MLKEVLNVAKAAKKSSLLRRGSIWGRLGFESLSK